MILTNVCPVRGSFDSFNVNADILIHVCHVQCVWNYCILGWDENVSKLDEERMNEVSGWSLDLSTQNDCIQFRLPLF